MKKAVTIATVLLLLVSAASPVVSSSQVYQGFPVVPVYVDGRLLQSDVPAVIMGGRTMVPLKAVLEVAGSEAVWDQDTRSVRVATPLTFGRFDKTTFVKEIASRKGKSRERVLAFLSASSDLARAQDDINQNEQASATDLMTAAWWFVQAQRYRQLHPDEWNADKNLQDTSLDAWLMIIALGIEQGYWHAVSELAKKPHDTSVSAAARGLVSELAYWHAMLAD